MLCEHWCMLFSQPNLLFCWNLQSSRDSCSWCWITFHLNFCSVSYSHRFLLQAKIFSWVFQTLLKCYFQCFPSLSDNSSNKNIFGNRRLTILKEVWLNFVADICNGPNFADIEETNNQKSDTMSSLSESISTNGSTLLASEMHSMDRPGNLTNSTMTEGETRPEVLNKKAVSIINRVRDKLTGKEFKHGIAICF